MIGLKGQQILLINFIATVWLFFSAVIIYDMNFMAVKFLKYLFDIAKRLPKLCGWIDFSTILIAFLAKRFAVINMIPESELIRNYSLKFLQ